MNVTIIGVGNMGRGIGHRLVAGGHDVTVVDRDPEEAGRLAEELSDAAQGGATSRGVPMGARARCAGREDRVDSRRRLDTCRRGRWSRRITTPTGGRFCLPHPPKRLAGVF
jgi:3-hydroxyacyl-CoA dehydrogenase